MARPKQLPESSIKRLHILQTAAKMFMNQGYSNVSMDALCLAVPVSKRTLYNHFADKKALFSAVMQERCRHVFEPLRESLESSGDPEKALTGFARLFLDLVLQDDAICMFRIAASETAKFPELGALFYECGPQRSGLVLAAYLSQLHEKGIVEVQDAEEAAHFLLAMLKSRMHMQRLMGLKRSVSEKEKRHLAEEAVRTFLYGCRKR